MMWLLASTTLLWVPEPNNQSHCICQTRPANVWPSLLGQALFQKAEEQKKGPEHCPAKAGV